MSRFTKWCRALFVPAAERAVAYGCFFCLFYAGVLAINTPAIQESRFGFLLFAVSVFAGLLSASKFSRMTRNGLESLLSVRWRLVKLVRNEDQEMNFQGAGCLRSLISLVVAFVGMRSIYIVISYCAERKVDSFVPVIATLLLMVVIWLWAMREFFLRIKVATVLCLVNDELLWISRDCSGYEREQLVERARKQPAEGEGANGTRPSDDNG